MSTISYRRLDENFEPTWGQGQQDFISDTEAVAQAIRTRLLLFQGEWWLDTTDGLPLWQQILGTRNSMQSITLLIQDRITGTPHVKSITSITPSFNSVTRQYSFVATVTTTFSTSITISNLPINLPPV